MGAYVKIAEGSGAGLTFTSIPATYTDLRLVIVGNANFEIQFNGSTGTVYSQTFVEGNGTAISSNRFTNSNRIYLYNNVASTVSLATVDIFSYAGSSNKSCLIEFSNDANGSGYVYRSIGLWRNTAAITSIAILNSVPTTATLYGIKES